jgi:hypothetical protein
MSFYFSDAAAVPPNELMVRLRVKDDVQSDEQSVDAAVSATSLTAQEQTDLQTLLNKLKGDGLTALGYTES